MKKKNVKCAISGSNGFVGSKIAEYLKDRDLGIIGIGRNDNNLRFVDEYVKTDLVNLSDKLKIPQLEVFVHCAAIISFEESNTDLLAKNILMTLNSLSLAVKNGCSKFILISSVPVIGSPLSSPINETHVLNPRTIYHKTKLLCEEVTQLYNANMDIYVLRIPSPLSCNMKNRSFVPTLIEQARQGNTLKVYGKGTRKQSYLDLRDLANVIFHIISSDVIPGIYNVTSSPSISNLDMANLIKRICASESKIELVGTDVEDHIDWNIDDSKLKEAIPNLKFHSIEETLKYMNEGG
ncbi:NAD dependent epimerase/dehydratase family protein [Vibrio cholerae HC-46B1]|uniref:NAD-dependent epimerase/dehydratase family protein n=1 Tax=Vibrio cholerae TaxID=666 RepID=UPI00028D70E0|nr:SDR family oxidoreductase [Vibrio cholerae]EKL04668.1 NAD dependent epimerase/dehydratase family protein [Vibrio cholerae HC-41B1]EKL98997.1 NAD dependent epimerase/dehydratase family protein [Vibrio cholerae HC-46B1]EKM07051.1 NAD dependent epimerase/dehydratase family protein [Vibrio cholerae HC-44C1]